MYGTRSAARSWRKEFGNTLRRAGFTQGKSNPCLFRHNERGICTFVHGDDFVSPGSDEALEWLRNLLEKAYKITRTMLGNGNQFDKKTTILNRILEWDDDVGISLSADPRHVQVMLDLLDCKDDKPLRVPIEKSVKTESDRDKQIDVLRRKMENTINQKVKVDPSQCLDEKQATLYRAVAARATYLTTDRADIGYAVKEARGRMSSPTHRDLRALERIARYLKRYPVVKQWFVFQPEQRHLTAYIDTDWAGCR